jgi:hypothetical protein
MATTKTLEHEAKKGGQAAGETTEATGKALQETGDRTARITVDNAEHVTRTAAGAAERTARVVADTAESMAEAMANSLDAETIISTTRESIAVATRTQQQAVASVERSTGSVLTGLTEMQKEVAEFVSERIRQDLETQQELLRCRTLEDLREVQSRFFRITLEQYSAEATKLMQLSTEVFTRSLDFSRADVRAAGH